MTTRKEIQTACDMIRAKDVQRFAGKRWEANNEIKAILDLFLPNGVTVLVQSGAESGWNITAFKGKRKLNNVNHPSGYFFVQRNFQ